MKWLLSYEVKKEGSGELFFDFEVGKVVLLIRFVLRYDVFYVWGIKI